MNIHQKKLSCLALIIIFITIIGKAQTKDPDRSRDRFMTFEEFKNIFNKTYASPEEQHNRSLIFNQNKMRIFQQKGCSTCGINKFTDMTKDQFSKKFQTARSLDNVTQSKPRQKLLSDIPLDYPKARSYQVVTAPSTLDWRTKNVTTPAKNQGSCGSCWAFSTTGTTQSYAILKGLANNTVDLAEQYLLQCTNDSSCDGGVVQYAMDLIINGKGMPNQTTYPYKPTGSYSQICSAKKKNLFNPGQYRISKYRITDDNEIILLLQNGPLNIILASDSLQDYAPTKQNNVTKCGVNEKPDHAVMLVGYTPTYWIVKNSWGNDWGVQGGFVYITRDRTNNANCKIGHSLHAYADICSIPNCDTCKTTQVSCANCASGYYQAYKDSNQQQFICSKCNDTNCDQCYGSDYTSSVGQCFLCKTGYALDSNSSKCVSTSTIGIENCKYFWKSSSSSKYYCQECVNGYVVTSDSKSCLKCNVKNCITCSTGSLNKCSKCQTGYSGSTCTPQCKVSHCAAGCTIANICDTCDAGYSGQTCQNYACSINNCQAGCSVPNVCDKCDSGWSGANCNIPTCSIANCQTCSAPNVCSTCAAGYSSPATNCTTVSTCSITNCKTCSSPTVCSACNTGYSSPATNCTTVTCSITNCKTCSSPTVCSACNTGYSSPSTNCTTVSCSITNCKTCTSPTVCSACNTGFSSPANNCTISCSVQNCLTCSSNNVCSSCVSGYSGANCAPITSTCNITNCVTCKTSSTCGVCKDGYSGPTCQYIHCSCNVQNCLAGCSQDPNICDLCNSGSYGPLCNVTDSVISQCKASLSIAGLSSSRALFVNSASPSLSSESIVSQTSSSTQSMSSTEKNLLAALIVISIALVLVAGLFIYYICKQNQKQNLKMYPNGQTHKAEDHLTNTKTCQNLTEKNYLSE